MNEEFPLKQIFLSGIKIPFQQYKLLIKLSWPFILLLFASSFYLEESELTLVKVAYGIVYSLIGLLALVNCHRIFIWPEGSAVHLSTFRWSETETYFLLNMLKMMGIVILLIIPLFVGLVMLVMSEVKPLSSDGILSHYIFSLTFLPLTYFIARWSLIFPHAATDNKPTISWAWQLTAGYGFKLFLLIGMIPFLTGVILQSVTDYVEPSYLFNLIKNSIWLVIATIEICFLSLSYKWLMSNLDDDAGEQATAG